MPAELTVLGHTTTPLDKDDLMAVHAVQIDPLTWRHLPSSRPRVVDSTRTMIRLSEHSWSGHGFGMWTIRDPEGTSSGPPVPSSPISAYGTSSTGWLRRPGATVSRVSWPGSRSVGRRQRRRTPVTARMVATNPGSVRVAEKAGLSLAWQGRSSVGPDRLVYADRPLDAHTLGALIALG